MYVIQIKNSIAMVRHTGGEVSLIQTSNIPASARAEYYENQRKETQEYFAGKRQPTTEQEN